MSHNYYTPSQKQEAFGSAWARFERSTIPLKEIKDEDLINYYNNKQEIVQRFQYDLYFNTSQYYDQTVKKDSEKSLKEIHNNIYNEETQRSVPVVTSHLHGHRLNDLEGRALYNHKRVESKSDYRHSGIPMDVNVGLPKNTNDLY